MQPPKREERFVADLGFRFSNPRLGTGTVSAFFVQRKNGINLSGEVRTVNGRPMELYENRDEDSKGVEVDLRSRRLRNTVQVFVNVTAMSARIEAGNGMQRDQEIPRAMAGGGVSASKWGFDLNLFWRFLSSYESLRFAEPDVPRRLGGFNNIDLMLARRVGARRQTRIYAEVWNVADKAYSTVVGYPDYGRRAMIGLEHGF
jgi:outer membrane receptor protein involved in Fe transport